MTYVVENIPPPYNEEEENGLDDNNIINNTDNNDKTWKFSSSNVYTNIDPYSSKYNFTNSQFLTQFSEQVKPYLTEKTDYVLSPETYFAEGYGEKLDGFDQTKFYQKMLRKFGDYPNVQWVTGIQFYDLYKQNKPPSISANKLRDGIWVDYYNSALAIQYRKEAQVYHKSKLVVGVENMPFKTLLKPLLGDVLLDLGGTVASRVTQKNRSVSKQRLF